MDAATELSTFFEGTELDVETINRQANVVHQSAATHQRFAELLRQYAETLKGGQGDALRLAVGLHLIGQHGEALQAFAQAPAGMLRHYYAAQSARALGRLDDALSELSKAAGKGWDALEADMLSAAIHVQKGDPSAASKLVTKHASAGKDRCEWYFVRGLLAEQDGRRAEAIAEYERGLNLDPDYGPLMYRAAWLHDICGDDAEAIKLYERLAVEPRAHVNALINLAVLYEDLGRYDVALACLRRVLAAYPNHTRARLFFRDVQSSAQMLIDDGLEVQADARSRLLETPISEFELSVRARNCLKKMKIHTLGDLLKYSEAELLAYKNFGDTSLNEIKVMLTNKGLRLGQPPEEIGLSAAPRPAAPEISVPPGSEAALSKSVSELELSVRARRCLQRLNVATRGELIQRSEPELLAIRNFGATSLTEIKSRLADHGLQLSTKKA